jgi:hypothetical protein
LIVHGTGLLSGKEKLMVKSIVSQTERNENNKCAKKCTKNIQYAMNYYVK